jgi:hypothetical protein
VSFAEKLKACYVEEIRAETTNNRGILTDLSMYRKMGTRSPRLEVLFQQLNSVPLTSVNSERVFSTTTRIKTRLRCRMSDTALNALTVLRHNKDRLF